MGMSFKVAVAAGCRRTKVALTMFATSPAYIEGTRWRVLEGDVTENTGVIKARGGVLTGEWLCSGVVGGSKHDELLGC